LKHHNAIFIDKQELNQESKYWIFFSPKMSKWYKLLSCMYHNDVLWNE